MRRSLLTAPEPIPLTRVRGKDPFPVRLLVPLFIVLILLVMSSGCIEKDENTIEEQYSKVNGKVKEVSFDENTSIVRFRAMKLFGNYENEAPYPNFTLESGEIITLIYSGEKKEAKGFPDVEEGDYVKVWVYRDRGETDFRVKYMEETPHPYRNFFLSLGLIGICIGMVGFFFRRSAHFRFSLDDGVREILASERRIRREFNWRSRKRRARYYAGLCLFLLFSPYLAILLFQVLFSKTYVIRWDPYLMIELRMPYDNIFTIQLVLFMIAVSFLVLSFRYMEKANIIRTGRQKIWMFEILLGFIIVVQVLVQMALYSVLISTFNGFFSGLFSKGYPQRDLDFHEVFLTFLPGWLMFFTGGLFLTLHGSTRFFRQQVEDGLFTEKNLRSWSDPDMNEGCEAFGEYDRDDDSCQSCGGSSPEMVARCQLVSQPPDQIMLEDLECGDYGVDYDPDDEICMACSEGNPRIWFWCRKRTLERQ